MKRVFRRLRARGGESFAEILVALLIVALATLLLASMVGASGSIDMATRKEDEDFYKAVSAVETETVTGGGKAEKVKITPTGESGFEIDVNVYEDNGLSAYKKG